MLNKAGNSGSKKFTEYSKIPGNLENIRIGKLILFAICLDTLSRIISNLYGSYNRYTHQLIATQHLVDQNNTLPFFLLFYYSDHT